MDSYIEFASLYDRLMDDFDYEKWYEYIEEIFQKYSRPKNILEMACGTGNISYFLAKAGYDVTAFDLSEEMLSIAYNKLMEFENIKLFQQDMRDFSIDEKYDSIIATCDSINYITKSSDLLSTFKNVYDHLEEGGLFIFDINSHYKLKNIIGNNTFIEDRDDVFYIWQNYYNDEKSICEFYLTFFKSKDGDNFTRIDEVHMERAYRVEEIVDLLKKAGFENIEYFDAFTFNPINKKSERINFIAF